MVYGTAIDSGDGHVAQRHDGGTGACPRGGAGRRRAGVERDGDGRGELATAITAASPTTAVHGEGATGVHGQATTPSGIGVHGFSDSGRGVYGYSENSVGVMGFSRGSYGVWAHGVGARLFLDPGEHDPGPPTSGAHEQGAVRLDANGALWVCAASGTPGTWVRPGFNAQVRRLVHASSAAGTFAAGERKDVTIGGLPAVASAVALNLTATSTGSGAVIVYPFGAARPEVAQLAVNPRYRWTGFAIVRLGAGRRLSVHNTAGTTRLSIDLAGFYP